MNNLHLIMDKILSDANSEAAGIIAAAEAEADKIRRETMEQAELLISKSLEETEKDADAAMTRAKGEAAMKQREILLRTKVGLINSAYDEAAKRILAMDREGYCNFLSHLLADAIIERLNQVASLKASYGDDENELSTEFTVIFNERDKTELGQTVIKNAKAIMHKRPAVAIDESCADISGGLILRYGDTQTNCSIDAVIADARRKTEAEVMKLLASPKVNE